MSISLDVEWYIHFAINVQYLCNVYFLIINITLIIITKT